jgi:nucleotide-binding universal stress UspA family protein
VSASSSHTPQDRGDGDDAGVAAPAPRAPADEDTEAPAVVVGVDGSEVALGAVRWAAHEAAQRGSPLRIVHAAPYLGRRAAAGGPSPELPRARQITGAAFTVARHAEHDLSVTTEVVPGEPIASLQRAAAAGQLLVLGSSTTGAADEMVLASVTLRVAARSVPPVVVVPRHRGAADTGRPVVAVLGIGDADDDAAVAEFAAQAADRARSGLSVLQTRPSGRGASSWADDPDQWRERFPDLEVAATSLPGASAGDVLSAACPAPLLVMSTGHGTLLHRSLDAPHRWLLRHCTSPMALVPQVHRTDRLPREEIVAVG